MTVLHKGWDRENHGAHSSFPSDTTVKPLGKNSKLCIAQSTHTAHPTPRDKLAEPFRDCKMEFMPFLIEA